MRSGSRGSSSSGVGTENLLESSGVSSLVDSRSTCYGPNSSSPLADMEFLSAHETADATCERESSSTTLDALTTLTRKNYLDLNYKFLYHL